MSSRVSMLVAALVLVAPALALASEPGTGYGLEPPDTVACPAAPVLLNDFPTAAGWRYDGTTESADAHGEGTCGGGAGDVLHRFVAPSDGDLTIRIRSGAGPEADFDPVLWVASACGAGARELACADDSEDFALAPELSLTLTEGQEIVIAVDGYVDEDVGAWRGPYTLELTGDFVVVPEAGPFVHLCHCSNGVEATICTDAPCEDTSVCNERVCGGMDPGVLVTACYGSMDRCRTPEPAPGGPAMLSCLCANGSTPVLQAQNTDCEGVGGAADAPAEMACTAWCSGMVGTGSIVGKTRCARDHSFYTASRHCPSNEESGISHMPMQVCDARDASLVACDNTGLWGTRDQAFFNLEGCGCGCANAGDGCPDQDDPDVTYRSHDPDACTRLEFQCPMGQTKFFKPYCGCGCQGPPEPLCADPDSGSHGAPDASISFRYTGDWPACNDQANWPVCGANETAFFYENCGCGCYSGEAASLAANNPLDPVYTMVANGNYRAVEVDCPFNADPFANPLNGGCTYQTGVCPERDVAARIISNDWDTCRARGVSCPPGEYPFLHPVCGCGCIPDGVVPTRAN